MVEIPEFDSGSCPIPNTHRRYHDVHLLWHEALEDYFNPARFRTRLNTLIQETRNITWILQKEKNHIPNFDPWYSEWQDHMRKDDILRWLHDARTKITKMGDLEMQSVAQVKIIANWQIKPAFQATVPPGLTLEEIAKRVSGTLDSKIKREGLIQVERLWIANSLPGKEVLGALSYCYGMISKIVLEAHEKAGATMKIAFHDRDSSRDLAVTDVDGPLPCMTTTVDSRRATWTLRDLSPIQMYPRQITQAELEKAEMMFSERYGTSAQLAAAKVEIGDIFANPLLLLPMAQTTLVRQGYHLPMVWLRYPTGKVETFLLETKDRTEKYLAWERIAERIGQIRADGLVWVMEVWLGSPESATAGIMPADTPDKREALWIGVATINEEIKSYFVPFARTKGAIDFGQPEKQSLDVPNLLNPVLKVWAELKHGN